MSHPSTSLSKTTIAFHWMVGLLAIAILALGFYMTNTQSYGLYTPHKSLGVLFLVIAVIRVLWRLFEGFPTPIHNKATNNQMLVKLVHFALLALTLLLPISGILMSYLGGYGVPFFDAELLPKNLHPITGKPSAISEQWANIFGGFHGLGALALSALVVLHAGAALKHHLIDKDMTLLRMFAINKSRSNLS